MKVNVKTLSGELDIDLPPDSSIEDFKKIIAYRLDTQPQYVILKYYNVDDYLGTYIDLDEYVDISSPNIQISAIVRSQPRPQFHITIHYNEPIYDNINDRYTIIPSDGIAGLTMFISNDYSIPLETVNDYVNVNNHIRKIIEQYGLDIDLNYYDFVRSDKPKIKESLEDDIYIYIKNYENLINKGVSFHMIRNRDYFEMFYPEIFQPVNVNNVRSESLEIPPIQLSFRHNNKK